MDEFPEDDQPTYIPARRGYEVVRYVPERHHMEWWQILLIILAALLGFWVIRALIIGYAMEGVLHQVDKSLGIQSSAPVRPAVFARRPPPLVGPYHLPLSMAYRLQGVVHSVGTSDYLATSLQGAYILIPAKDCQLVNGGPYCRYHGTTVTGTSGNP